MSERIESLGRACPVDFVRVIIHLIVVVSPAPFDPRNPNIS